MILNINPPIDETGCSVGKPKPVATKIEKPEFRRSGASAERR